MRTSMIIRLGPKDTDWRRGKKRAPTLSDAQRLRLRAAITSLRHQHGTWKRLAEVTGVSRHTLYGIAKGTDFGSVSIAFWIAKAAGVTLEHLLGDKLVAAADLCPTCGQPRRPS